MTPIETVPDRLVLCPRLYPEYRAGQVAVWVVRPVIVLLLVGFAVYGLRGFLAAGGAWAAVPAAAWGVVTKNLPAAVAVLALLAIQVAASIKTTIRGNERLVLSPTGIEYQSPWPAWLQFMQPGWSLRWDALRSATLSGGSSAGLQDLVLRLDGGGRERWVFPYRWIEPGRGRPDPPRPGALPDGTGGTDYAAAVVENSAVLRYLTAHAPQIDLPSTASLAQPLFAIDENARSLAIAIAFIMLASYALLDTILTSRQGRVAGAFGLTFAAAGVTTALVLRWMRRGGVPRDEAWFIAAAFGFALFFAGYRFGLVLQ